MPEISPTNSFCQNDVQTHNIHYLCSLKYNPAFGSRRKGAVMEDWELDYEWLKVQHWVKGRMGHSTLPDLNGILFLIGIQELGRWRSNFTKEEKQDLMHIAVCSLLSFDGYYAFKGRDADGWPHYELKKPVPSQGVEAQERFLKLKAIQYFKALEEE